MSKRICLQITTANFDLGNLLLPLVLKPSIQNYHWGKLGENSLVARLSEQFDPALPYAELWYGNHPKAPSLVVSSDGAFPLDKIIQSNTDQILGFRLSATFGPTLPFLAKVLSIEKALSIQAHPSIENAKLLYAKDPTNYPDAKHKPEIAVALTEVKLLHGWVTTKEAQKVLSEFPELGRFLNKHGITFDNWDSDYKKRVVATLFKATQAEIAGLNNMILKALVTKDIHSKKQEIFLTLAKQVELSDVGLLLALFLRYLTLDPGQSIFTPAAEIHAYLSGDLFECMANSDNVIRAGLTPKFQDVAALLSYANFEEGSCSPVSPSQDPNNPSFFNYFSEASEFKVSTILKSSESIEYSKTDEAPELLVLLEGEAKLKTSAQILDIKKGEGLLIPACVKEISLDLINASIARVIVPFGAN